MNPTTPTTPDAKPDPAAVPLSPGDVVILAAILNSTSGERRVARVIDDKTFVGTARAVVRESGSLAPLRPHRDDVRAGYLHVTGTFGEHFWPIAELMAELNVGEFTTDYRPGDHV